MISKYLALPAALALTACGGTTLPIVTTPPIVTTLPIVYATDDTTLGGAFENGLTIGSNAVELRGTLQGETETVSLGREDVVVTIVPVGELDQEVTLTYKGLTFTEDEINESLFVNGDQTIALDTGGDGVYSALILYFYSNGDESAVAVGFASVGLQTLPENLPGTVTATYDGIGNFLLAATGENPADVFFSNSLTFEAETDFETIEMFFDLTELGFVDFAGDVTGSNFSSTNAIANFGEVTAADLQGFFAGPDADEMVGTFTLEFTFVDDTALGMIAGFGADQTALVPDGI